MQIVLNGKPRELADDSGLDCLMQELAPGKRRIAVEINGEILPRSRHAGHALKDGDQVEIVQAIGGG